MVDPVLQVAVDHPRSLRSKTSNSSIASGASLTRRPRTRARSRTLTGSPRSPHNRSRPGSPVSELAYLDNSNEDGMQDPSDTLPSGPQETLLSPSKPPRSPRRNGTLDTASVSPKRSGEALIPRRPHTAGDERPSKVTRHTSGLQTRPTASQPEPPPSAFSRDPSLTGYKPSGFNFRDSVSTQGSGTSSSLYPPSTSTTSALDSPLYPASMDSQDSRFGPPSYDPEISDSQDYDGDDVSYRLKLLVNNNYFLPPAHSKPSPSDLAPPSPAANKKSSRATTPTFMDFFRGRSRSKPTTPTNIVPPSAPKPILRATGDSITPSVLLQAQPRLSSQVPRLPFRVHPGDRSGRVVVVREKLSDIAAAAKQAEQEMKVRGGRRDQESQNSRQEFFDDVIDPTDAVDLPPPSSKYPFAVQTSALHGLGVQDSVGAALLADRLPPPNSLNMSTSYDADDDWRKALLHEAVHHSLESTSPDISSFSMFRPTPPSASSQPTSPAQGQSTRPTSRGQAVATKRVLEQRIISNPRLSDVSSAPSLRRKQSNQSQKSTFSDRPAKGEKTLALLDIGRPTSFLPRADTPSGPLTPLTPPPRKYLINPLYSLSQTELPGPEPRTRPLASSASSVHSLRKVTSSSTLDDAHRAQFVLTPPIETRLALSSRASSAQNTTGDTSFETSREDPDGPDIQDSYLDNEEELRTSISLSAINGRPSISEYSQPSPTMSAFNGIPNHDVFSPTSSLHLPSRPGSMDQRRPDPIPRHLAMSPPPRISSSLGHVPLAPPPRSFRYQALIPQPEIPERTVPETEDETLLIVAPEPTTPPLPASEIQLDRERSRPSLSLEVSTASRALHSGPGPTSPTSFFDTIQSQPNAMDDLDSSSSESEDESPPAPFLPARNRTYSNVATPPKAPFMRLGNHSTPYIGSSTESRSRAMSLGVQKLRPVGNTPVKASFFVERAGKSDSGHDPTLDFYKFAQQRRPATAGEAKTASAVAARWRNDGSPLSERAQESLRKLDGMLLQHMESEKDTMRRIASSLRSTIPAKSKDC